MMLQVDEVAMPATMWDGVINKRPEALAACAQLLNGTLLYEHAMAVPGDWEVVSLRVLAQFFPDMNVRVVLGHAA